MYIVDVFVFGVECYNDMTLAIKDIAVALTITLVTNGAVGRNGCHDLLVPATESVHQSVLHRVKA